MTKTHLENKPDSLKLRHHDAAMAVLDRFAKGLAEKARRQDGSITAEQIEQAASAQKAQENLFDEAWLAVKGEIGAASARQYAAIRNDPFGRLLVSRFAHLLEGREAGDLEHGAISRDILKPFFQVIRMMVGADTIEEIDREIRAIVDDHAHDGDEMRDATDYWDHLASDPHVSARINLVFARMALRFADYERRKRWFIQLINDNLHRDEISWEFTEEHFVKLIRALFRDVRAVLANPERAAVLAAKFGHEDVEKLRGVMANVDRDVAALHNREAASWQ